MPCEKCTKIQFWCTVLLILSLTGWSQMLFFSHLEEGFPSPPPLVRHATHLQYLHRRGSLLIHSTSIGEARYSSAVPPSVRHVTHLQHLHRWGMLLTCSASIGEARYSPAAPPSVRHVTHLQYLHWWGTLLICRTFRFICCCSIWTSSTSWLILVAYLLIKKVNHRSVYPIPKSPCCHLIPTQFIGT